MVRALILATVCLAVLALPGASLAAPTPDAEPNDNVFELTGPISADGAIGTLATVMDVDEFLVQFQPAHHVKLLFSLLNAGTPECPLAPTGSSVHYLLRAPEAVEPFVTGDLEVGTEFVDVLDKTTPGEQGDPVKPLHLTFSAQGEDAAGCSYRFTVTDSGGHATDAIDPTPLPDIPDVNVPEPNDLAAQAFGPLAGDTYYYGAIDAEGDIDRMRAWLFPGQEVTVELGAVAPGCGDCEAAVTIEDPRKNILLPALTAKPEQVVQAPVVGTPAENLIRVSGKAGTRWRLRLSPADAVLPAAPAGTKPRRPRKQYRTGVTLRRGAGAAVRYLGKVSSTGGAACRSNRLVVLRHAGSGLKRFSITRTRADGTFTVTRRSRTEGTVYVAVVEKITATRLCRFARSPRVRA
ncbi:MAG: hypothetical protein QOJ46_2698 [bacterium]